MNLPFTNIRQVLSLHNKVSPEKIFLTVISDRGREELSYGEFSARCHQTANFLQEDLGIKPGDHVAIKDNRPADIAVLLMASWLVGAIVVLDFDENAKAFFIYNPNSEELTLFHELMQWHGIQIPIVQIGGEPSHTLHFDTLVRGMPNTFFNEYPEPTLASLAYRSTSFYAPSFELFSQGRLLDTAQTLANTQIITGNQRLISYMEIGSKAYTHDVTLNTLGLFMAALLTGSSLIVDTRFYIHAQPEVFWREIVASRSNVACISIQRLPKFTAYAREQKALGNPIYQQDIKQLRHIYCPDASGEDARKIIQQFTAMFPFPIITNS